MKKTKLATVGFSVIAGLATITGCSNAEAIAAEPVAVESVEVVTESDEVPVENVEIIEEIALPVAPNEDNILQIGSQIIIDREGNPHRLFIDNFTEVYNSLVGMTDDEKFDAVHSVSTLQIVYESWTDETRTELSPAVFRVAGRGADSEYTLITSNGDVIKPDEVRFIVRAGGLMYPKDADAIMAVFPTSTLEDNEIKFIRMCAQGNCFFYEFEPIFVADARPRSDATNFRSLMVQKEWALSARGWGLGYSAEEYLKTTTDPNPSPATIISAEHEPLFIRDRL